MEKTKILLISDDEIYSERLTDCVRKMKTRVKISRISFYKEDERRDIADEEKIETSENHKEDNLKDKFIEKLKEANISIKEFKEFKIIFVDCQDLLIFDEVENLINNLSLDVSPVILRLTESLTTQDEREIYRLSKVSELINKSIQKYSFIKSSYIAGHITRSDKAKIYSFISSSGGSGVSSIALCIGRELATRRDENILYISLGPYHQERYFFNWSRSNNLREYLFHMFYGDIRYCFSLDNYMKKDEWGLYHFNITTFTNKIDELTQDQFEKFIENIISLNLFHTIIFDLGCQISDKTKSVLDMSHKKFFIEVKNDLRKEDFVKYLDLKDESTVFIENFHLEKNDIDKFFEEEVEDKNIEEIDETNKIKIRIPIRRDDEAFFVNEGLYDIRRDTNFSQDISKLVDSIYF